MGKAPCYRHRRFKHEASETWGPRMPMVIEHASALATGYQDLLRASLQHLAPLSRRRGVSPVVHAFIKRALTLIEAALVDPAKRKEVEGAAAALRSCVQLVQEGLTSESDRPLLEDVAAAFSLIFEALDLASDTNPGAQVPVRDSASDSREETRTPVADVVATARSDDGEALGLQLTRLERLYVARADCVRDPTSTFGELRAAEERIHGREATVFRMAPSEVAWETAGMVAGAGGIRTLLGLRLKGQAREWTPAFANALAEIASASKEQQLLALDILRMSPIDEPIADLSRAPYRVLPPEDPRRASAVRDGEPPPRQPGAAGHARRAHAPGGSGRGRTGLVPNSGWRTSLFGESFGTSAFPVVRRAVVCKRGPGGTRSPFGGSTPGCGRQGNALAH